MLMYVCEEKISAASSMTTISDAGSRSILNDYIRYLVDQNRFYNAADALVSFALELSGVVPGKQTLIQEIAARAQECRERARTAHVINPAQLDDLYAYVRNTLEPLCANLCADIAADHYFLNGQCNVPVERTVAHRRYAVCAPVLTTDARLLAFVFDCESRYHDYDRMLVGLNPQVFYLEDDEVVAVTDCAQRVQSAAFFIECARQHPAGAIDVCDCTTRQSLVTAEPVDVLLTPDAEPWYWSRQARPDMC